LTVFAGFILAVLLHAAPVVWVEIEQNKPSSEASAPVVIRSTEQATSENHSETTSREAAKTVVE
jgi:hypothetical protein